jgi:small acid-soluble spore protein K (minor)
VVIKVQHFDNHGSFDHRIQEVLNMRNNAKNFPNQSSNKLEGDGPRAKAEYASKRADGTINTHPQERMRASNNRDSGTSDLF